MVTIHFLSVCLSETLSFHFTENNVIYFFKEISQCRKLHITELTFFFLFYDVPDESAWEYLKIFNRQYKGTPPDKASPKDSLTEIKENAAYINITGFFPIYP